MIDSPIRMAWQRFCANRRGLWSLRIFLVLFAISLSANLLSNDRPLVVSYQGSLYWPLISEYSERTFGGEFDSPADYLDPFIQERLAKMSRPRSSVPSQLSAEGGAGFGEAAK